MNPIADTVFRDSVTILFVLVATLSVLHAAYRFSSHQFTNAPLKAIVASWVITWAFITIVGQALGFANLLSPITYVATVMATGVTASAVSMRMYPWRGSARRPFAFPSDLAFVLWGTVGIGFVVRLIWISLTRHPTQWDSIAYHLPRVGQWAFESGFNGRANLKWFYPGTNELLQFWFSGGMSGDYLYTINNLGATLFLGLATYGLSRQLCASRMASHLIALGVISNYVLIHQALDNKNDVPIAALLVASLFLFSAERLRSNTIVIVGLAVGLMLGIKYYAAAIALGTAGIMTITILVEGVTWTQRTRNILLFGFSVIVTGGGWYFRNWLATGEPMFPKAMFGQDLGTPTEKLLGTALIGSLNREVFFAWMNQLYLKLGLIPFLALLAAPAATLQACLDRSGLGWRVTRNTIVFCWCLFLCFSLYLITPFTISSPTKEHAFLSFGYVTIRLGLPFFVLTTIFSGTQISIAVTSWFPSKTAFASNDETRAGAIRSVPPAIWIACGLLAFVQLLQISRVYRPGFEIDALIQDYHLIILGSSLVLSAGLLLLLKAGFKRDAILKAGAASALLVTFSVLSGAMSIRWHSQFSEFYDQYFKTNVFSWMDDDTTASSIEKLVIVGHRTFPFSGSRRQREIHQLGDMPVYTLPIEHAEQLSEHILNHRFDALVAERHNGLWIRLNFEEFADSHSDIYRKVFEDTRYIVFRVRRGDRLDLIAGR